MKQYFPILEKEVDVMISCFRDAPAEWGKHLRRNAAAVIMKVNRARRFTFRDQLNPPQVAFGYSISGAEDHFVTFVGNPLSSFHRCLRYIY